VTELRRQSEMRKKMVQIIRLLLYIPGPSAIVRRQYDRFGNIPLQETSHRFEEQLASQTANQLKSSRTDNNARAGEDCEQCCSNPVYV